MTDPEMADATYIEPITPEVVARIIEKERPDAILPTMGGQTGLNTALALDDAGVLEKYGVELIGAKRAAIEMAEDRKLFREAMDRIGLENPRATIANTMDEAMAAIEHVGLPAIIRPAFTMGGTGGGVAYNREDYERICKTGLDASPVSQILIDESLLGWKEFEMEVVRDKADNCIIVCSIENIDPMGVHTGDSITVAPALTLTDKEYQMMRNASIAVLREIGVETGGSNVQFAVHPDTGRLIVIEMNPRVSRSSALASKATGFPIAKIAAKLAVGYTLDELDNDITQVTPASFEPTIDYVVTKIPRFAFEKFPGAEPLLTTAMKSVGEAMAIGRTFHESVQKALCSLETGLTGFDEIEIDGVTEATTGPDAHAAIVKALSQQTPDRLRLAAQAMRHGLTDDQIHAVTRYDPWFLARIREIVDEEAILRRDGLPRERHALRRLKQFGFSDARLGLLTARTETSVRAERWRLGVRAVFKRIDTCAAEFEAQTPYMYSTYEAEHGGYTECEARPTDRRKVVILGGGPNRIGQGIEFDYCCCHACYALTQAGYETIMVNCNPETVSTDYDTSDRLYFEPLTLEHVLEILRVERDNGTLHGVIVQFGGQTPLKLANALHDAGIPILGTTPDAIDLAEDRERFQALLHRLDLKQPENGIARSAAEAQAVAKAIGYPLVIRPSYVLGGRAMEIVRDDAQLTRYIRDAVHVSGDTPVLLDSYLSNATEVDVDAISDGRDVHIAGVMEHIEEAGVHSGDSACSLPPYSLTPETVEALKVQTRAMALALGVVGLMNVQFAIQNGDIYVLEVNPRASRTVPVRRQGHRQRHRRHRRPRHGRRAALGLPPPRPLPRRRRPRRPAPLRRPADAGRPADPVVLGQGGGDAVQPLPRRRHPARPGDALDRRGDGLGPHLPPRLPQGPARRRHRPPRRRHAVRLGQGRRQDRDAAGSDPPDARPRLPPARHRRHREVPHRPRHPGGPRQQGLRRPPAHRRHPQGRRRADRVQHHRRHPVDQRQPRHPVADAVGPDPVLHHGRRGASGGAGDAEPAGGGSQGAVFAGVGRIATWAFQPSHIELFTSVRDNLRSSNGFTLNRQSPYIKISNPSDTNRPMR